MPQLLTLRLVLLPPLLMAIVTLGAWLLVERFTAGFALEQATQGVRAQARIAARLAQDLDADAGRKEFAELANRLGGVSGLRVTYVDADGTVLGDSRLGELELARVENHADRPEIRYAMDHGEGVAERFSATLGSNLLYVAVRFDLGGRVAIARVAEPMLVIEKATRDGRVLIFGTALATVLASFLLVYLATRRLVATIDRQHSELERRVADRTALIEKVQEAGSLLTASKTTLEAGQIIRVTVEALIPGCSGALALFKPSRNLLQQVLAWGDENPGETHYGPSDCWALRRGMAHFTTTDDPSTRCNHLVESSGWTTLCLPFQAYGEILGLMQVMVPQRSQIDSESLQLIKALAEHAAVVFGNIQLNTMLREQAIRDPLTGLYNRRYLTESLDREIARALRHEAPLSVLMIDIDHFKSFNDRFGHEAGDHVLCIVAHLIADCSRGEDVACRYGGEEFVLVLVGSDGTRACEVGQRLCNSVGHAPLSFQGETLSKISVSIGVAAYESGESSTLLKRADEMLYRAKQAGRNRVVGDDAAATASDP